MEHGNGNSNLETENFSVVDFQDGGVDTNIAGTSSPTESKEFLLIKSDINQNNETTKFKNNNENAETLEFGINDIIDTTIQDKERGKNHYICKFCSQVFNKHQALGGHMNGHSKEQRNLKKFEKITTWIHETYPPPLNTTLTSEAKRQDTPTNGVAYNSYKHLVEVGNVYSQLDEQWRNQQSTQQIQSSQKLQIQQQQYHQAQEPQRYQGLQSNQAVKSPQSTQALQSPQNYQDPQRLQNYQTLQRLQNHQASQGSQSYQTPQQFQNYQTPQEFKYYQAPKGPQYHQTAQRFQNYQTPQGHQSYETSQGSQSHQAPQGPQSYPNPQGSQSYQAPQGSQSYQAPQGQWQQLVVDATNQQNINLNSKTSNKPASLIKAPSNEKNKNLSKSQGFNFQKEAQGSQNYKSNPYNLHTGGRLTTRPFISEELNKEYNEQLRSNKSRRSNQMISTPHNYDVVVQNRPTNSPNTSSSFKDEQR